MKNLYEAPEMEILILENQDVIRTSGTGLENGGAGSGGSTDWGSNTP